ncbi:HPr family phosphocarrier protein [Treponema denticola]|uniref:Phosphocarrier protein HPr n=2 Tax=Treponema denticola TaxID=158 RepID=Q73N61_TREDE|nr:MULTISPECIES: HPr family phosphocarrier protein [Treponema]AAS11812.1 phosphocarrier protein HPr [Treponema denticola ATCC 35405]EGC77048.1 phosphocarrier protein HPr [Treponema denticola F0402]EMB19679.1 HPr family phosphocarrier [Treponema denticola OTK]EMB37175.1 HPr family phosphocarrier [Treponema denticola ATCC 33521]EMB41352.1 HPr family phosphocarrier [Treponema denticola ATCC 35404]
MISKTIKVQNRAGIHARPAALIAQKSNNFSSEIFLCKEDAKINAKSVIGIITMAAAYGTELTLTCDGPDEKEASEAIETIFNNKFEEE